MLTNQSRRLVEWGKNVLLILLTLSAVWLIRQSTLYEGFGTMSNAGQEPDSVSQPMQSGAMQDSIQPFRLAVQNQNGRYLSEYDWETTGQIFESQLGILLREALSGVKTMVPVTQVDWQAAIAAPNKWVYYDFGSNLPLDAVPLWLGSDESNPILQKWVRYFLLVESDSGFRLYCREDGGQGVYVCDLEEGSGNRFSTATSDIAANGFLFAFEDQETSAVLKDHVIISEKTPTMWVYEAKNPLEVIEKSTQEELLRALDFNPSAAAAGYEGADSLAIREGSDILRILNDGSITYHSSGNEPRYNVPQDQSVALVEYLHHLLTQLMGDRCGEAAVYLMELEPFEDDSVSVTFGYSLNGAPVQVFEDGFAAQFFVQNGTIKDFTVHLRQYTVTEEAALILPYRQTLAMIKAKNEPPKELTLAYKDQGNDSHISVEWILF